MPNQVLVTVRVIPNYPPKYPISTGGWTLFASDGEMKMFKREVEVDGIMADPLKATHSVRGVTAREYLHYFFDGQYKMDWDSA